MILILETGRPIVFSKPCSRRISEIEMVTFSDYRLVGTFVDACAEDVSALSCGRVELFGNRPSYLSQGKVKTLSLFSTHDIKTLKHKILKGHRMPLPQPRRPA